MRMKSDISTLSLGVQSLGADRPGDKGSWRVNIHLIRSDNELIQSTSSALNSCVPSSGLVQVFATSGPSIHCIVRSNKCSTSWQYESNQLNYSSFRYKHAIHQSSSVYCNWFAISSMPSLVRYIPNSVWWRIVQPIQFVKSKMVANDNSVCTFSIKKW